MKKNLYQFYFTHFNFQFSQHWCLITNLFILISFLVFFLFFYFNPLFHLLENLLNFKVNFMLANCEKNKNEACYFLQLLMILILEIMISCLSLLIVKLYFTYFYAIHFLSQQHFKLINL